MYKTVSERFSRKVTFVSFILSIFVMYIHANKLVFSDAGAQFAPVMVLNKLSAETFGRIGVPFFFLQSGYWMFQFDIFEPKSQVLKRKLKKKVFTLGIPFLLWNTLGLLFFLVVTRLPVLSSMIHEGRVVPFTLRNVLGGIFLHQYNLVFWFMQDLIVLTALSPVWLRLLRNRLLTDIAIGGLLVLVMLGINSPIFQSSSLLLFLAGGGVIHLSQGVLGNDICGFQIHRIPPDSVSDPCCRKVVGNPVFIHTCCNYFSDSVLEMLRLAGEDWNL